MIKIDRGCGETKGTRMEILIDFAGIVNHLYVNCEIPKEILLDFVNAGLVPDERTTVENVLDLFEKMFR